MARYSHGIGCVPYIKGGQGGRGNYTRGKIHSYPDQVYSRPSFIDFLLKAI
jgi:hypothetical protein